MTEPFAMVVCRLRRRMTGLAILMCCLVMAVMGCASEEKLQKSKGYYQEGLANLEVDRQRSFVSFQKAIKLNPNHKEAHYSLGHVYALQAKYLQAEEEFREAVRIDSDYSEAYNYLGQVLERQNRWPDAIRAYRQALSNPLYGTPDLARFNLGRALVHEGDLEGATQAYEDALLISPPTVPPAVLNLELGRVYSKLGYEVKAKETLTRVKALDKGGQYAAEASKLLEHLKP
jgi:type IV pilus assembly protein PilF